MRDLLPQLDTLPWQFGLPVTILMVSFVLLIIWVKQGLGDDEAKRLSQVPFDEEVKF